MIVRCDPVQPAIPYVEKYDLVRMLNVPDTSISYQPHDFTLKIQHREKPFDTHIFKFNLGVSLRHAQTETVLIFPVEQVYKVVLEDRVDFLEPRNDLQIEILLHLLQKSMLQIDHMANQAKKQQPIIRNAIYNKFPNKHLHLKLQQVTIEHLTVEITDNPN